MNTSILEATGATAVNSLGGNVAARVGFLRAERVMRFLFFIFYLLTEVTKQWDTVRVLYY